MDNMFSAHSGEPLSGDVWQTSAFAPTGGLKLAKDALTNQSSPLDFDGQNVHPITFQVLPPHSKLFMGSLPGG